MRIGPFALFAAAVALAGLTLGCGGAVYTADPGGGDSGAGDAAAQDSGPGPADGGGGPDGSGGDSSTPWSPECPAGLPATGTACSKENLQCEYGSAWWSVSCDPVVQCQGGLWAAYKPSFDPCSARPGANPPSCPADFASVSQGSACATNGVSCIYAQGLCACQVPLGGPIPIDGGTGYWGCAPEQGCPFPRARIGTACTHDGMNCTYEECSYAQTCQGGVWQGLEEACAQGAGGAVASP